MGRRNHTVLNLRLWMLDICFVIVTIVNWQWNGRYIRVILLDRGGLGCFTQPIPLDYIARSFSTQLRYDWPPPITKLHLRSLPQLHLSCSTSRLVYKHILFSGNPESETRTFNTSYRIQYRFIFWLGKWKLL